jgi:hypothetical protein
MRAIQFTVMICLLSLSACENKRTNSNEAPAQIPEAMQESKTTTIISKRGYEDIVNSIYENLIQKSVELKALDEKITNLPGERSDSASAVSAYIAKNSEFYYSADQHVKSISDSLLRSKVQSIINASKKSCDSLLIPHNNLLASIDLTIKQTTDQREALKLLLSLPVIEEYQKLNLPSKKPLQELNNKARNLKAQTDSLLKKKGI